MTQNRTCSVFVVTLDHALQELWTALRGEGIRCQIASEYGNAIDLIGGASQPVLVLDSAFPSAQALYDLAKSTGTPLLLLADPSAVLNLDLTPSALEERVGKPVKALELVLRAKALIVRAGFELPAPSVDNEAVLAPDGEGRAGHVIAIFSPKGGAGKSTVAVNLAVALAQVYRRKTLLVDTDLWFGDVAVLLNSNSPKSLSDVCEGTEVDIFGLPRVVVPHSSGIGVVARPLDPVRVENVNGTLVAQTVQTYRALYDFVVVDMASTLDDMNVHLLDIADRVLLVTTPELTSIHNSARFLRVAEALDYAHKISLVVNRADSKGSVESAAIEDSLGIPIAARLVSAGPVVVAAANAGRSVMQIDPEEREQITRDLVALATHVTGEARPGPVQEAPFEERRSKLCWGFWRKAA